MRKPFSKIAVIILCAVALVAACAFSLFPDVLPATAHPAQANARSLPGPAAAVSPRRASGSPVDAQRTKSNVASTDASVRTSSPRPPTVRPAMAAVESLQLSAAGDRLAIRAVNAPLAGVLDRIGQATGASVEIEDHTAERVTVDVGPTSIRDALQALLDRSQHDYILVSPKEHAERVERIVVIPRAPADASRSTPAAAVADDAMKTMSPMPDVQQERERQRRQFEQTFGACVAQGCDAS